MDEILKTQRTQLCERKCREQGIPFTMQRRAILLTVLDLDNHPTADQVHACLMEKTPGISRTTVYRTLEILSRMGVITKTCHPGSVVRYDPRIDIHHHLVCLHCDEVKDISDENLDVLTIPDTSHLDFEVHDFRVQLRGLCRSCQAKEES